MFLETPANIDSAVYANGNDHTPVKYRKCARQSTRSIRKNVSLVFNKSLGSKCRKKSPFNKL